MREYRRASDGVAADGRLVQEKTGGAAWQTLAGTSSLAGEIARTIASDAELLTAEFHGFAA